MKATIWSALISATLVLASVLPARAAPDPAPHMCGGLPATLVGSPGTKHLVGTAGPDVVVTNGASRVDTGEGDDVVCVTGTTKKAKQMDVIVGAGNDSVTVTSHNGVHAVLGAGDDTFHGRAESDVVSAGYSDIDNELVDTGIDTIHTGAGHDLVRSSGHDDTVSLGRGADTLSGWSLSTSPADGGDGRDTLRSRVHAADGEFLVVNNRTGTLSNDGLTISRWSSFSDFQLGSVVLVLGSAEDETFDVAFGGINHSGSMIRGGAGDDVLLGSFRDDGLFGGPGHDRVDGRRGEDFCVAERREHCENR